MSELREVLQKNGFRFNKQFGQNFITDKNLLKAIVGDAEITADDTVLEIGAGAGTLTAQLAKTAKRVIAFEIDKNLENVLGETLAEYSNIEVKFCDFQKISDAELAELVGGRYKVVANLPYYITTPLIMRFLESEYPPQSITVMIQKEVAERIVAKPNTSDYGVLTLSVGVSGSAEITRIVGRQMFYPAPNVDSAVVRIDVEEKYSSEEVRRVKKLVKSAFAMRRKTLANNIASTYSVAKDEVYSALREMGINESARGETLSLEQFLELSKKFS